MGRGISRTHVFVDETKERGFLLAATALLPRELVKTRKVLNDLVMPGQRRLHFAKENDSRRRTIISAFLKLQLHVILYDANGVRGQKKARQACLSQLVVDLIGLKTQRLVLERDDSLVDADRRLLYELVRGANLATELTYEHLRTSEECLLAIPDALAWCWAKGGDWRRRITPLIAEVKEVS